MGDQMLFAREDTVEAAWRIVDPVLNLAEAPLPYRRGTWGPKSGRGPDALERALVQASRDASGSRDPGDSPA